MAEASTTSSFLRTAPAPLELTQAEVPGENKPWWESISGLPLALCLGNRENTRKSAWMFGSGQKRSVGAVAGSDPSGCTKQKGPGFSPAQRNGSPIAFNGICACRSEL